MFILTNKYFSQLIISLTFHCEIIIGLSAKLTNYNKRPCFYCNFHILIVINFFELDIFKL
jgi:hypothetical protein